MEGFDIVKIRDRVWRIWDREKDTFFLVEGDDTAAVIDTGFAPGEKILPMLRTLTDKPMILILTHAHIDHMHHMDEFDTVYLCHEEFKMGEETLRYMMAGKDLDLASTLDMGTGTVIELGNCPLEICHVPGHTPGSVAVYVPRDKLLFTGDAIGSGCGVWMQLPHSGDLRSYEKSLRQFMIWLLERGGDMDFWGGHCDQSWTSRQVPGFNPLSMGLLADLADLTRKTAAGEIQGEPVEMAPQFRNREARYAAWGRAEMLYDPDKL